MSTTVQSLGRAGLCIVAALTLAACGGEDGSSKGDTKGSDGQLSSAQTPEGLHIVPLKPNSFHELRAGGLDLAISFGNFEAEDDPRSKFLVWKVNSVEVHRGISLSPENFKRGDEVEIVQLSEDETQTVASYRTKILNSAPRVTSATLRSKPNNGAYLECNVGARDEDNDTLYYLFKWLLDGDQMPVGSDAAVDISDVKKGQVVEAIVTAFDGVDRSEPFRTAAYEIDNLPPKVEGLGQATITAPDESGKRVVRLPIQIEDPDGDQLDVDVTGQGAELQWLAADGVVQWVVKGPVEADVIHVRVSDGRGATVEKDFEVPAEVVSSR